MPSLDTNCLLRWLLDNVPEQTARVDVFLVAHSRVTIPDVALIEVVFVLERVMKIPRASVAAAMGGLAAEKTFSFDRAFWDTVIEVYLAHPRLSVAEWIERMRADTVVACP
ncbi:MAG: hypothetical protein QM622_01830 [Microbacterium sp.]